MYHPPTPGPLTGKVRRSVGEAPTGIQYVSPATRRRSKPMGSSQSSDAPDEVTALFDQSELKVLRKAYNHLTEATGGVLEASALMGLAPGVPWQKLHAAMRAEDAHGPVRWRNFLAVVASVCKGRPSERREFVAASLYADPPSPTGLLTKSALMRLLSDASIASRGGDAGEPPSGLACVAADALLGGGGGAIDVASWSSWVNAQMPALPIAMETYLRQYLLALGHAAESSTRLPSSGVLPLPSGALNAVQEPLLRPADGQGEGHELLEPTGAWLINLAIGAASGSESAEWRCLYASRVMGLSMNRFNHHALGYAGPTLLVALTEAGEVFGAYIDTPLKASDKYFGGSASFLFTLRPHFHIYRPTTISKNYALFNPCAQQPPVPVPSAPISSYLSTTLTLHRVRPILMLNTSSHPFTHLPTFHKAANRSPRERVVLQQDLEQCARGDWIWWPDYATAPRARGRPQRPPLASLMHHVRRPPTRGQHGRGGPAQVARSRAVGLRRR